MATFPDRKKVMDQAVYSILPQVDKLYVYLNEYDYTPQILRHPKIIIATGDDLGDGGKFFFNPVGYVFTIDDDLIYPPDYVENTLRILQGYDSEIVATYHGLRFKEFPVEFYNKSNGDYFRCLNSQRRDEWVHIGGTGVMAFHSDCVELPLSFSHKNMADIFLGLYCQEKKIPILSGAHRKGWITYNPLMESKDTIYQQFREDHSIQNNLINNITWQLNSKPL